MSETNRLLADGLRANEQQAISKKSRHPFLMMRRLARPLAVPCSILLIVMATNYALDPAQLFGRGKYEKGLADLLLSGWNAGNVNNYNDRLLQKYYIHEVKESPEICVIGGSSAMEIGSFLFQGKRFFNNSVGDISILDYLGIYGLYREKLETPSVIILGIDPWVFDAKHVSNSMDWFSISEDADAFARSIGTELPAHRQRMLQARAALQRYGRLVSPSYFQLSVRSFVTSVQNGTGRSITPTRAVLADFAIKLADGRLSYNRDIRSKSKELVRSFAIARAAAERSSWTPLPSSWLEFERFVRALVKEGVTPVFFLPPLHPAYYESPELRDQRANAEAVERRIRNLADRSKICVIGSYDARMCGVGEDDFYDALHAKPEAVTAVFSRAIRERPLCAEILKKSHGNLLR